MSNKQLYEVNGFKLNQEQYERYLERINNEINPSYIVSKMKEQSKDENVDVPYIIRQMVLPVLEELCYDDYFSDEYVYNYICENWSFVENGYDLGKIAEYLYEYRYGDCSRDIAKLLKKQLKKQIDTDGYLTIYRGFNYTTRPDGNSFTLSKAKAIWFANRYASMGKEKGYVNKYKIHISDVLAFITDRGEAEIVAWPDDVILLEQINY
jgi:hypothetical protein